MRNGGVFLAGYGAADGNARPVWHLFGHGIAVRVDPIDLPPNLRLIRITVYSQKLIAAHAVDAFRTLKIPRKYLGDVTDIIVAFQVTKLIIDRLKVVDIAEYHSESDIPVLNVLLLHLLDFVLIAVAALHAG